MRKRFLAAFLSLLMVIGMLPQTTLWAQAASSTWDGSVAATFAGGSGTEADPYQIATAEQLARMASVVNTDNVSYGGKYYTLTDDIVLNDTSDASWTSNSPNAWTPIGNSTNQFKGVFDGAGHTVSGVYINDSTATNQGLFGFIGYNSATGAGATVKNVGVVNSAITASQYVGGVVGYDGYGTVDNCYSTGSITADWRVGGVVGVGGYNCVVKNSYNESTVIGSTNGYAGGVVGIFSGQNGIIYNCYNTGSVSGGSTNAGGIVGDTSNNGDIAGSITNCYNTGEVSSAGLKGTIVGSNEYTVQNCYWLSTLSVANALGFNRGAAATNCASFSGSDTAWTLDNASAFTLTTAGAASVEVAAGASLVTALNAWADTADYHKWRAAASTSENGGYPIYVLQVTYNGNGATGGSVPTDSTAYDSGDTATVLGNTGSLTWTGHTFLGWATSSTATTATYTAGDTIAITATTTLYAVWESNYWIDNAATAFAGGSGTAADPYQIATAAQLARMASVVNTSNATYGSKYYTLTADIVLNDTSDAGWASGNPKIWTPIGDSTNTFKGVFDGARHTISGIYINDSTADYQGLFGAADSNAVLKNISVVNCSITANQYVGGVVGYLYGTLDNCYSTGSITGDSFVGGIAGSVTSNCTVQNSYSTSTITCITGTAGGIVGAIGGGTKIRNCYNIGTVSGGSKMGGIVGDAYDMANAAGSIITNCYNAGEVSTGTSNGALIGNYWGYTVKNCYWFSTASATDGNNNVASFSTPTTVAIGNSNGMVPTDIYAFSGSGAACTLNNASPFTVTTAGAASIEVSAGASLVTALNAWADTAAYRKWGAAASTSVNSGYPIYALQVIYNGNGATGGSVPTDSTYGSGATATVLGNTGSLTKTGYAFSGWATSPTATTATYTAGDTIAITADTTLYAVWESNYWIDNAATAFAGGSGTEADPYQIATAAQLAYLSKQVQNGSPINASCFQLTADIVLNDTSDAGWASDSPKIWTPIGDKVNYYFNGTFDGAGHTISGIYINDSTADYQGLFGAADTNAVLKNISVVNSSIVAGSYVGGVVGYSRFSVLNNCYSTGSITGADYVGGIVGYGASVSVADCHNASAVTASASASGDIGGIAGRTSGNVRISNSYNLGTISGGANAGGIVGYATYPTMNSSAHVFRNCFNAGAVSGATNNGAIVGSNNYDGKVQFCYWLNTLSLNAIGTGTAATDCYTFSGNGTAWTLDNASEFAVTTASGDSATVAAGASLETALNAWPNTTAYRKWLAATLPSVNDGYPTYTLQVAYSGNGSDGGSVPTDDTYYQSGTTATVLDNTGSLTKAGYVFLGWATSSTATTAAYTVGDTFTITADTALYAVWAAPTLGVTYDGNGATGGSTPTDSTAYDENDTITVLGNTGALTKTGYTFGGWATSSTATTAAYTAGSTFTITADTTLYAVWTAAASGGSSSSGSSSSSSSSSSNNTASTRPTATVDGTNKAITSSVISRDTSGQIKTTVTVDESDMKTVLSSKSTGDKVTLAVSAGSDVSESVLTGQTVKDMESKSIVLAMQTEKASYTIPAKEINIDAVSAQIGASVPLSDVKVSVQIAEASAEATKVVENAAESGSFSIITPPIDFTISCEYNGQTVSVSKFNAYVERMVAIPDGVDPSKITTAVVVAEDGTSHHVPTKIIQLDGIYYAQINSLTNSVYAVVWHPVTFADMENHWAQADVNDMGSRMVITGTGENTYEPNRNMTRAEFAAVMVRALGLTAGEGITDFTDIDQDAWYSGYVETAVSYGILQGYDNGTFAPNATITREQAMTIVARAMTLTGVETTVADADSDALLQAYTDQNSIAAYAKTAIATCLQAGIVNGSTDTTLSPKGSVTRAQVAVMVARLLQKSDLID